MNPLPINVLDAREAANIAADDHHKAWDQLCAIETPSLQDLERWLEVRKRFHRAQETFEALLRQIFI